MTADAVSPALLAARAAQQRYLQHGWSCRWLADPQRCRTCFDLDAKANGLYVAASAAPRARTASE